MWIWANCKRNIFLDPLEGWLFLNDLFLQTKGKLPETQQELSRLSTRIEQLKRELVDYEAQRSLVVQQIDLGNSSPKVERAFQLLSTEQEILSGFKEKIASPDWSADLMTTDDLKVAFTVLGILFLLVSRYWTLLDMKLLILLFVVGLSHSGRKLTCP